MKLFPIAFLGFLLIAGSCANSGSKPNETQGDTGSDTTANKRYAKDNQEINEDALTVEAQFVEFHLGDASHYIFQYAERYTPLIYNQPYDKWLECRRWWNPFH